MSLNPALIAGVLVCLPFSHVAGADDKDDFLAFLSRVLPRRGVVESVFAPRTSVGESRVGYDFATGAWYAASSRGVQGRDERGNNYFIDPQIPTPPPTNSPDNKSLNAIAVAGFFPSVWLDVIRRNPDIITSVQAKDAGFSVTVQLPPDHVAIPPITIVVDADGKVTNVIRPDFPADRNDSIPYQTEQPSFVPIPSALPGTGVRLVSFRAVDAAEPGLFSVARVEAVASQVRLNDQKGIAEMSERASKHGRSTGGSQQSIPRSAPNFGQRMRLPLLLTGCVVCVIGIGLWIWKRRH